MKLEDNTISKAKSGDRGAQRRLYDTYSRSWFGLCLRYCQNRSDAEDVLQNALIKIFGKIEQFNPALAGFNTWSSKIVVNESLMFLKGRKSFNDLDDVKMVAEMHVDQEEMSLLSAEALTKMVQKLPDGYRTVFNLYVIEGYAHNEISEILNISVGTSKSQLSKAKQLLRKRIEVLL